MVTLNEASPRGRHRRGLWIGLAVLLVIAVAVGAFFLGRDSTTGSPSPAAPSAGSPAGDSRTRGLVAPPEPMHWEPYRGFALPVSSVHGPAHISGGVASGYTRTPAGALIAAAQIVHRLLLTPGPQWRRIAEKQLVGPGRDDFIAALAGVNRARPQRELQSLAGFQFVSYTDQRAVITIVAGQPGSYRAGTQVMVWRHGDWRLYAPVNANDGHPVEDLSGYVVWNAEG